MDGTFTLLSTVLVLAAPFLLMELLARYFYKVSFRKIILWWIKNRDEADTSIFPPSIFGLFFILLIMWTVLGVTSNTVYKIVVNEKHALVYLGNSAETKSSFIVNVNMPSEQVIEIDSVYGYNYTFKPVHTKSIFEEEGGSEFTGKVVEGFSPMLSLVGVLAFLLCTLILVTIINAIAHPVVLAYKTLDLKEDSNAVEMFDSLMRKYGVSVGRLVALSFAMLVFTILAITFQSPNEHGNRMKALPPSYVAGAEVQGIPIMIEQHGANYYSDGRETDFWNIVFMFNEGFDAPVYVTLAYDRNEQPSLFDDINESIQTNTEMTLTLASDLGLILKTSTY